MATLVLTAVGSALGGPLGRALGAVVGQGIDSLLFAPKPRQGARLTDLKIQTSSYGDAISRIYGSLRVAGVVIWATDLIERRQKRSGGKGQPKVVEYSYNASLAVALSSRPITGVGRIWADGRLLRDTDGRLAEQMKLRVYTGSEDQTVDPLIAAVVGIDRCSAFRGIAYVVIEELDLTAFGNRIPQLSFEVTADPDQVRVTAIAADLAGLVAPEIGPVLAGYAAGGDRVRDLIAPLARWAALGLRSQGPLLQLAPADWAGSDAVDVGLARIHPAATLQVNEDRRAALAKVARAVQVRHYDPARDYQTSQQEADVAGGGAASTMVELPAALSAAAAQQHVRLLAQSAGDRRRQVMVTAGLGAAALPIGQLLPLAVGGGAPSSWRIAERAIGEAGVELTLVEHLPAAVLPVVSGDGGAAILPPALGGGTVSLAVFDVPGDGEVVHSAPVRMIAAASSDPGWRGADLWWLGAADDEGEAIGRITGAAALGQLNQPMAGSTVSLIDWSANIEVVLINDAMQLENVTQARMLAGANLAMIGDEAVQFQRAEAVGERRWRLSGLLRARGGSKGAAHASGTPFVLLGDPAILMLPASFALQAADRGAAIEWRSRGETDSRGETELGTLEVAMGSQAMVPLSPVHGRAHHVGNGDMMLRWIPRSRAGAWWRDSVDVPAGEAVCRWLVTWDSADGVRTATADSSEWLLSAGSFVPGTIARVVQFGDHGASPPLAISLP